MGEAVVSSFFFEGQGIIRDSGPRSFDEDQQTAIHSSVDLSAARKLDSAYNPRGLPSCAEVFVRTSSKKPAATAIDPAC